MLCLQNNNKIIIINTLLIQNVDKNFIPQINLKFSIPVRVPLTYPLKCDCKYDIANIKLISRSIY